MDSLKTFLERSSRKLHRALPNGKCLFRSVAHQLCGSQENHSFIRLLIQRFENLNKAKFSPFLMDVNEHIIDEHIKKIGRPYTWGTHIEILAIATLYGISVFITRKSQTGSYYWEEVKPLKPEGLSYPVVPPDTLPSNFHVPSHIEICYYDGVHYDSVVSVVTNKVSQCTPQTPQALSIPNVSNTVIID